MHTQHAVQPSHVGLDVFTAGVELRPSRTLPLGCRCGGDKSSKRNLPCIIIIIPMGPLHHFSIFTARGVSTIGSRSSPRATLPAEEAVVSSFSSFVVVVVVVRLPDDPTLSVCLVGGGGEKVKSKRNGVAGYLRFIIITISKRWWLGTEKRTKEKERERKRICTQTHTVKQLLRENGKFRHGNGRESKRMYN